MNWQIQERNAGRTLRHAPGLRVRWGGILLVLCLLATWFVVSSPPAPAWAEPPSLPLEVNAVSTDQDAQLALGSVTVGIYPNTSYVHTNREFSVSVYIDAGANLINAVDIHLSFDPTYLSVARDCTFASPFIQTAPQQIDNTTGRLSVAGMIPGGSTSGSFTFCTVYLRTKNNTTAGTTIGHFQSPLVVAPGGIAHTSTARTGTVVISVPPTPTITPTPSVTPTPSPTPTTAPGEACVLAFHDLNRNLVRDPGEPLLADAVFSVASLAGDPVAEYTSDGIHEPYCFSLPAWQTYRLDVTSPPGFVGLGPQSAFVVAVPGHRWEFAFAQVEEMTPTPTTTAMPTETPSPTTTGTPVTATPTPTKTATPVADHYVFLPLVIKNMTQEPQGAASGGVQAFLWNTQAPVRRLSAQQNGY
jgi:hypothetical protein